LHAINLLSHAVLQSQPECALILITKEVQQTLKDGLVVSPTSSVVFQWIRDDILRDLCGKMNEFD
jgi:hypothetical protein